MLVATIIFAIFAIGLFIAYLNVRKKTANCLPGENERKLDKVILLSGSIMSVFLYILTALAVYTGNTMVSAHVFFLTWIIGGSVGYFITRKSPDKKIGQKLDKKFFLPVTLMGVVMYILTVLVVFFD